MTKTIHSAFCAGCVLAFLSQGCGSGLDSSPEDETDVGALEHPSICGGGPPDWQNVETYNGTLGPSVDFVDAHERPVGHMLSGCSGTLIGADLFLTAGHCISGGSSQVEFNYQLDPSGNPRATDVYNVAEVLENALGGVDYAIVRLNGTPGAIWGTAVPAVFGPKAGQAITLIQHPGGIPKVIEGGTLGYQSSSVMSYSDLDTEGGSSGSGILQDRTGYVVGVHTQGSGTLDDICSVSFPNRGRAMDEIWKHSPIIKKKAMDTAKIVAIL